MARRRDPRPPLTTFTARVRQVDLSDVDSQTRRIFDHFFPEFARLGLSGHYTQQVKWVITNEAFLHAGRGRERRFAGEPSLPRGRWWVVEDTRPSRHRNTLLNELFAYASPWVRVTVELADTHLDRRQVENWRAVAVGQIEARESLLQLIRPHLPGRLPHALSIDANSVTLVQYPVTRRKESVDGVLDLRQPAAQDWIVAYLLDVFFEFRDLVRSLRIGKDTVRLWACALRILVAQELGGGLVAIQHVARALREMGAQGVVYPSARSNAGVIMRNGRIVEHRGFNFVDYRGAVRPPRDARGPTTIGLAVPTYPESVQFFKRPGRTFAGSWEVHGLQELNAERYRTRWEAIGAIAKRAMMAIFDGAAHPSDEGRDLLFLTSVSGALVDRPEEVATVGRILSRFALPTPAPGYGDLEYNSPDWFFTRRGRGGRIKLQCIRCWADVRRRDNRVPERCPKCNLGDRATPTRWWPQHDELERRTWIRSAFD